ncbi:Tox-REase-5 domain-containing protein [Hyalangium rubrum]|uniref:Tox-REase-5 domain-containing protein n=1 Tax=Hyalangium rubrum TaxID=3103134 RepID=A0ABU5H159_9BACT|nr:Tox-REase-5 domain-containing protein [Hyalangium sp. s54d21]MDY7225850.1 Tox-REase-5 domain-containing protein [Hyalangium sp. s54d21]
MFSRRIPRAVVLFLLLLSACATAPSSKGASSRRRPSCGFGGGCAFFNQVHRSVSMPRPAPRTSEPSGGLAPIEARHVDVDYLSGLLVRAGVPPTALPRDRRPLTPAQAIALLNQVLEAQVPLKDFGPWRMAVYLLLEVVHGGAAVPPPTLRERMARFAPLLVLRPDGYLVRATTGRAVQQAGQMRFEGGALRAEGFAVGPFYLPRQGFLYPVDETLEIHPDAVLAGVYVPDEDTLGPMLEGVEQAAVDSITGLLSVVQHPSESLEALARLPSVVRTLVENSPQYYQHFQAVSHGERVRLVSRLVTNVALVCLTAEAGSARVASAGNALGNLRVPVLSLSARGTLALEQVVVPAGRVVTAVSAAPGALYIVHMAGRGAGGGGGNGEGGSSWKPPIGGPGRWIQKNEAMLAPAKRYQAQVGRAPEGWVYRVEHAGEKADLDDFTGTKLVEAKEPGYAKFLDDELSPLDFFEGFREMIATARRQYRVAQNTPLQWIVAEKRLADYLRKAFAQAGLRIEVVHIPAQP